MREAELGPTRANDLGAMLVVQPARARDEVVVQVRLEREDNTAAQKVRGPQVRLDLALRVDHGGETRAAIRDQVRAIAESVVLEGLKVDQWLHHRAGPNAACGKLGEHP